MDNQTQTAGPVGGSYLKAGQLKSGKRVQTRIDNRKANKNQETLGPYMKLNEFQNYNLELPVTISDIPFVVSIPEKSHDFQKLREAFGPKLQEWVGATILVGDDEFLEKVRVSPVSPPNPVATS